MSKLHDFTRRWDVDVNAWYLEWTVGPIKWTDPDALMHAFHRRSGTRLERRELVTWSADSLQFVCVLSIRSADDANTWLTRRSRAMPWSYGTDARYGVIAKPRTAIEKNASMFWFKSVSNVWLKCASLPQVQFAIRDDPVHMLLTLQLYYVRRQNPHSSMKYLCLRRLNWNIHVDSITEHVALTCRTIGHIDQIFVRDCWSMCSRAECHVRIRTCDVTNIATVIRAVTLYLYCYIA